MRCRQGHPMQPIEIEGITLEFCPDCGARYFDGEDARALFSGEEPDRRLKRFSTRLRSLGDRARLDPVTGLPDRACFEEFLESFPVRRQRRLAILLAAVDDLEDLRETSGPDELDDLLRVVGERVSRAVRGGRGDLAYRMGRGEFGVVLLGVGPDQSRAVAERIGRRIRERPVQVDEEPAVPVSLSIGVAHFDADHQDSLRTVFTDADRQLQEALSRGPDRISVEA